MLLSEFIQNNKERLLAEWDKFAASIDTGETTLTREELRDWADELLAAIAQDMLTAQSADAQERKSKGLEPTNAPRITEHSRVHASQRLHHGFTLNQVVSEYRALRASVVRLWTQEQEGGHDAMSEIVRFDEAMDQSLTESVRAFSARLERARDLFVGALGHDLHSPLSAIGFSVDYLLLKERELGSDQVRAVVRIGNAVDRMQRLIDDLLDFTRTRLGGRLQIQPEPADLARISRRVLEEFHSQVEPQRLIEDVSGDLTGTWDPTRIEQALSNLVLNALEHGRENTPVTVTLTDEGPEVVVSVHNEGEPLSEDVRHVMYDPLVRGDLQRHDEHRSLGLGLYITEQIVDAHGGSIDVSSDEDGRSGTTFRVRLPRRPPADAGEAGSQQRS